MNAHNTYVTDLRHFLDDAGEIVRSMPSEARQLASFLALIVDATSVENSSNFDELPIRCWGNECEGRVLACVETTEEILWFCPLCDQNGVIRNWPHTKWYAIMSRFNIPTLIVTLVFFSRAASADFFPISLGSEATRPLTTIDPTYPTGNLDFLGVPFVIPSKGRSISQGDL